jgi:hypothetical protein
VGPGGVLDVQDVGKKFDLLIFLVCLKGLI